MQYREIGKTGVEASVLGFGCMRLPVIDGRPDKIDYDKATELVRYAIDHGVNYVDTAYFYHAENFGSRGESEPFVGHALSDGYREKVNLATKMPLFFLKERDEMPRFLDEQLTRLRTDHLDFYLLHGLNGESWDRMNALGVLDFLADAQSQGLIRHQAFSFHGDVADFKRIVDSNDWAFSQIQYNYMDIDFQAGQEGLRYAADKGIGVVVMEPIKGGKLAGNLPAEMEAVFTKANPDRSPAEWALRYVWNDPGVSLLLSGMNEMSQVTENLAAAEHAEANSLSPEELAVYDEARAVMRARIRADCTACRYCQPCPSGVDIPLVIASLNAAAVWDDPNQWMTGYTRVQGKASLCAECGQCEDVCPQGLPIRELMQEAVRVFGS